jgi:hypothetical protein
MLVPICSSPKRALACFWDLDHRCTLATYLVLSSYDGGWISEMYS